MVSMRRFTGGRSLGLGGRSVKSSFTGGMAGSGGMSAGGMPRMRMPGISTRFVPGIKLGITTKFKLNDPFWTRRIGRARANAMRAQGGWIRKVARNSIRSRFKQYMTPYGMQYPASKSPAPPFSHSKHPVANIRNIQYDYDQYSDSLIVGAVFLRRTYNTTVPSVHEHAKSVTKTRTILLPAAFGSRKGPPRSRAQNVAWGKMKRRNHPRALEYKQTHKYATKVQRKLPPKPIHFPPRPFMKPALDKGVRSGRLVRLYASVFDRSL